MTTSLTDNYTQSRDDIIRSAFETIGVAVTNEPLQPEDTDVAYRALSNLAMAYKAHGMHLWKRGRHSLAVTASTFTYALSPLVTGGTGTEKPLRLLEVNRKTTASSNEITMTRLSLEEYENLPNKAQTGTPVNFYFEPGRETSTLYLWPAPDATFAANNTIEMVYEAPIQDMDTGAEDIDFPNEWYDALVLNLASRLAPKYGLEYRERKLLIVEAKDALDLARDYDVEDTSMYIMPNSRGK